MKDITEESIQVTIKKFICRDGKEYISSGPSEEQIEGARWSAEQHNKRYDFLHFVVDESLLYEYKSENWLHFKWQFLRKYITLKNVRGYNEKTYIPLDGRMRSDDMNDFTEEEFLKLVEKSLFPSGKKQDEYCFRPNLFKNDMFIKIIFFSGIIDFKPYIDHNNDMIKNNNYVHYSEVIFDYLSTYNNTEILEKLNNIGLIRITAKNITESCRRKIETDDTFKGVGFGWGYKMDLVKDDYTKKGTLDKYNHNTGSFVRKEEFSYYIKPDIEDFIIKCFSLCQDDKIEILRAFLNTNCFSEDVYGGICLYYKHYNKLNDKESFKKAKEIYSSHLYLTFKEDKTKKFAKPDDDYLNNIFLKGFRYFGRNYESGVKERVEFLYKYLPKFDVDIYSMWSTEMSYLPSHNYSYIKKYFETNKPEWKFEDFRKQVKEISLKEKLQELKQQQNKLKKEEEQLLEFMKDEKPTSYEKK